MYIYALKWKATDKISPVEAYLTEEQAQTNADYNNKKLNPNPFQKVVGRYWVVEPIYVREKP